MTALLAVGGAAIAFQQWVSTDPPRTAARAVDYTIASRHALAADDRAFAHELADAAARLFPRKGSYYANLALDYERAGDVDTARHLYERAFAMQPALDGVREALERTRRAPQQ